MSGKFFFIAIDIGNPFDVSLRAIETLKKTDLLYCEHTNKGKEIGSRFGLKARIYHLAAEEEEKKINEILENLRDGKIVSYISDAGLPILQDPGKKILDVLKESEFEFDIIPGASAISLAFAYCKYPKPWVVQGFWNDKVIFEEGACTFYYLACHDWAKFYEWAVKHSLKVEVYKDLTREKYQKIGSLQDFDPSPTSKGEFMVAIYVEKKEADAETNLQKYNKCLPDEISNRDRITILKNLTHLPKKQVYEWVHQNYRN